MPNKSTEDRVIDQKHFINTKLVDLIEYRQSRKWYVSIAIVGMFAFILVLMIFFMSQGKDVTEGWKEILLLMLGGFVGSFAKVVDFWFNNQENDNKLLEHADD
jgi:RsiW-degrading membrane proteinase PrsW (M82 family)